MVLEGSYELGNNHYHERQAPRNRNGSIVIGVITFIAVVIIFLLSFFLIKCRYNSAKCVIVDGPPVNYINFVFNLNLTKLNVCVSSRYCIDVSIWVESPEYLCQPHLMAKKP